MMRLSLLQLVIATALIAMGLSLMQWVRLSDQYYLSEQANEIRNFAYGLTLGLALAVIGFGTRAGVSEHMTWVARCLSAAVAITILIFAFRPLLAEAGYSRIALFSIPATSTTVLAITAACYARRNWPLRLFAVFGAVCAVDLASYQIISSALSWRSHSIALWCYPIPLVIWLVMGTRSYMSMDTATPVLAFSPMPMLLSISFTERLYEVFIMARSA